MKVHVHLLSLLAIGVMAALPNCGHSGDKKQVAGSVDRDPEHKLLQDLVGTFDAKVKMFTAPNDPKGKPMETTGVLKRKMILGGNYLQESFNGKFFDKPYTGMGVTGFDTNKRKYVVTWFDSDSVNMTLLHGTYDAKTKTLTSVGDDVPLGGGKTGKARDVLQILSPDEQRLEMYRQLGDKEVKVMEITLTRKKPKKN